VVGGIWLFVRQTTEFISWARRFRILLIFWLKAAIPIDRIAATGRRIWSAKVAR